MSRFFKSALFPILIVVVLAFFVQKLVSPHTDEWTVGGKPWLEWHVQDGNHTASTQWTSQSFSTTGFYWLDSGEFEEVTKKDKGGWFSRYWGASE